MDNQYYTPQPWQAPGFYPNYPTFYTPPNDVHYQNNVHYPIAPVALPLYPSHVEPLTCQWITGSHICRESFNGPRSLQDHIQSAHIRPFTGNYVCEWNGCGREEGFKAKYKLVNHVRVHSDDKPFTCEICHMMFARTENLKLHKRTHTGEKPYACTHNGCPRFFATCTDRKKHMKSHATTKDFKCKHCNKAYQHPNSLRKHMKQVHENVARHSVEQDSGVSTPEENAGPSQ